MLNQLILVGRITHHPESKILEDGKKVLTFQIAVQRSFKNIEGEYDTDFIKVTCWEGLASIVESYINKGVMIAVKGRVQAWKYQLEDDRQLNMLEIIAERVTYLAGDRKNLDQELND